MAYLITGPSSVLPTNIPNQYYSIFKNSYSIIFLYPTSAPFSHVEEKQLISYLTKSQFKFKKLHRLWNKGHKLIHIDDNKEQHTVTATQSIIKLSLSVRIQNPPMKNTLLLPPGGGGWSENGWEQAFTVALPALVFHITSINNLMQYVGYLFYKWETEVHSN